MPISGFIDTISFSDQFQSSLVHHEVLQRVRAKTVSKSPHLSKALSEGLDRLGIKTLFTHQVKGLQLIKSGKNIVVVTPTASGKSMIFNLPVLQSMIEKPGQHAVYLFPLKALEQDQALKLTALLEASNLKIQITTASLGILHT